MGYTHYWTLTRPIKATEMRSLANDIHSIVTESGLDIAGWDGFGEPEYSPVRIALNGRAPHEACETLLFSVKHNGFTFCKTRRAPYDAVVTASLLALKDRLEDDVALSSDGEPEDWEAGRELARGALRRVMPAPVDVLGPVAWPSIS